MRLVFRALQSVSPANALSRRRRRRTGNGRGSSARHPPVEATAFPGPARRSRVDRACAHGRTVSPSAMEPYRQRRQAELREAPKRALIQLMGG